MIFPQPGHSFPVVRQRRRPDPSNDLFGSPERGPLFIRVRRDNPRLPPSPARPVDRQQAELSLRFSPRDSRAPRRCVSRSTIRWRSAGAPKLAAPVCDLNEGSSSSARNTGSNPVRAFTRIPVVWTFSHIRSPEMKAFPWEQTTRSGFRRTPLASRRVLVPERRGVRPRSIAMLSPLARPACVEVGPAMLAAPLLTSRIRASSAAMSLRQAAHTRRSSVFTDPAPERSTARRASPVAQALRRERVSQPVPAFPTVLLTPPLQADRQI